MVYGMLNFEPCPRCDGTGRRNGVRCGLCDGGGRRYFDREIARERQRAQALADHIQGHQEKLERVLLEVYRTAPRRKPILDQAEVAKAQEADSAEPDGDPDQATPAPAEYRPWFWELGLSPSSVWGWMAYGLIICGLWTCVCRATRDTGFAVLDWI